MLTCSHQNLCGGCPLRNLDSQKYQDYKINKFNHIIRNICQSDTIIDSPIFINDGNRRRAEMTFTYKKGNLDLGFNEAQSHTIINIEHCLSLTSKLNATLQPVREFLSQFCTIKTSEKIKNKITAYTITNGDIWLIEADNGIDILLEIAEKISLEHRLLICEFVNKIPQIIRFSLQIKNQKPETIIEKAKPTLNICGVDAYLPAGSFLQASSAGQQALIDTVTKYIGTSQGYIADLFCGIGTFSYPLSKNLKNKITSIDSAPDALASFQSSINRHAIPNIKIIQKNLFKYPLDSIELKEFDIIIFDPPRAGASAQVKQINAMNSSDKPQKIIAVSCNPHTFINDADTLIQGGYKLTRITMVDQFVYADHFELVACFEKE